MLASPTAGQSQGNPAPDRALAALHAQDLRLAAIGDRILLANAALCPATMPITGMVLHSADQYDPGTAAALFAQGPLAIAAIVPGSAADRAGLKAGDALLAINGEAASAPGADAGAPSADAGAPLRPDAGAPLRDALFWQIAAHDPATPLALEVQRDGQRQPIVLDPAPGCRVLVEVITGGGLVGRSDGQVIQISHDLARLLDDDGLAVIFAHELAHGVLLHRQRLEAAGVKKGLAGEFGRNQRRNRTAEVEADRLTPHLLANAGYDPQIAAAFWQSTTGQRAGRNASFSFVYPSPRSRSALIAREIANHLPLGRGFSWPGHLLALRERPF